MSPNFLEYGSSIGSPMCENKIIIIIITLFIQYNERDRYQRLSPYEGIRPDVTDLESILMKEENLSTQGEKPSELD